MDPNTDVPVEPYSDDHGFGHGTPLDRYYIEAFPLDIPSLTETTDTTRADPCC